MDQLYTKKVSLARASLGFFLLMLGFLNLSFGILPIPFLPVVSLLLTGLLAFYLNYGAAGLKALFGKPRKPIRTFLIFYPLQMVAGFVLSILVTLLLHGHAGSNPAASDTPWLALPFMLMGEELFSLFILVIVVSLTQKKWLGMCLSALLFALIHIFTYYNGSIAGVLIHVTLIMGISRLILNGAAIKSNGILISFLVHYAYDVTLFLL